MQSQDSFAAKHRAFGGALPPGRFYGCSCPPSCFSVLAFDAQLSVPPVARRLLLALRLFIRTPI